MVRWVDRVLKQLYLMTLQFIIFNCAHNLLCVCFHFLTHLRFLSFKISLFDRVISVGIIHKETLGILLEFFAISWLEKPFGILVQHASIGPHWVVLLRPSHHIIIAASWLFTCNINAICFLFLNAFLAWLVLYRIRVGVALTTPTLSFTWISIWYFY